MWHLPLVLVALLCAFPTSTLHAQDQQADSKPLPTLMVEPSDFELEVGSTRKLLIKLVAADGSELEQELFFFSRSRRSVSVDKEGLVEAHLPGDCELIVRTIGPRDERVSTSVMVRVPFPPIAEVRLNGVPSTLYVGTSTPIETHVIDAKGATRDDVAVEITSSNTDSLRVDPAGELVALEPGAFVLMVKAGGTSSEIRGEVVANPVQRITLSASQERARTGEVVRFTAQALDGSGYPLGDAPVRYSVEARLDDDLGPPASGQIEADGRFVAELPGIYTISASCGRITEHRNLRVDARDVGARIELVGRGEVHDVHTSDLWVWQGVDGRDYAVTGTWGANGEAIFWDVTDPTAIERVSTVTVDARTVNDVKVSSDGRLCIISREGASNRRNGLVIIDVENPREAAVISIYDEGLTGGVHNVFIWEQHVFALSAGRRYDIIDIRDPVEPKLVSSFELDTPGHSIHDVWVADGIAYSSNWGDGVYMVDVGNGVAGGSLENPVVIGHYAYPSGWNHAAFPYHDKETGKFWVIAGDEAFPYGLNITGKPTYPRGWLHFIDFTDPKNPAEVARYEVPEAGTHNLWVEDDTLYVAYYNGGLRVVDISGDLLGDLYRQGREIAWYLPTDEEGFVPNAPMVWGPQPHKDNIFFSDWNTGLWAVKLITEDNVQ